MNLRVAAGRGLPVPCGVGWLAPHPTGQPRRAVLRKLDLVAWIEGQKKY